MAAVSPPHSPPPTHRSPTSPRSPYQHLADQDHCFLPSQSSSVLPTRARSGSRTYSEAQDDERQLARQRTRSRERAAAEDALEGRTSSERAAAAAQPHLGHAGDEISMHELRAEMESLLLLRRRSMSQPVADPDLPPTAPPTSAPPPKRPNLTLAIPTTHEQPGYGGGPPVSPTAPSPAETGTLVRRRSTAGGRLPSEHPLPSPPPVPSPTALHLPHSAFSTSSSSAFSSSSPSSPDSGSDPLASAAASFWLPASLHPELAPAEFKAFIREQTRPEALARRTSLSAAGGPAGTGYRASSHAGPGTAPTPTPRVHRRASLLRGEYKPRENDGVGDDDDGASRRREAPSPVPQIDQEYLVLKRTASEGATAGRQRRSRNTLNFEELTIKDLQRLEELAAKAEAEGNSVGEEEEGERLGRVLRRSLSLNPHRVAAAAAAAGASFGGPLPPTAEEPVDTEAREQANDEEAPIIAFAPGQILRRNARTKVRKTSIGGTETGIGFATGSRYGSGRRGRSSTGNASIETGESEPLSASAEGRPETSSEGGHEMGSPPSSDQQHIEVAVLPDDLVQPPAAPLSQGSLPSGPVPSVLIDHVSTPLAEAAAVTPLVVTSPVQVSPPSSPTKEPTSPSRHVISPASAEYDWATHHLPVQPSPPPPPAPQPSVPGPLLESQYTVHPQHLPRQPFGEIPPPQAVPVPQPQPQSRKETTPPPPSPVAPAPARTQSPKPAGKEKKSGWARLGLGRDDESKKRKAKAKERADDAASIASSVSSHGSGGGGGGGDSGKESTGSGGSSGFLSGIFGRNKRSEPEPAPPKPPSPPPEPRIPPPPPTASGVLLPNGRYANFYRLPIHVERAVYRLSHIKLANPRRPLYEQVLISNLMFWYLGLIQKPAVPPPPPAGPPVPIAGLPSPAAPASSSPNGGSSSGPSGSSSHPSASPPASPSQLSNSHGGAPKEPHKRGGLSKPSRAAAGARPAAETPMRTVSYEMQNQQLVEEQQQQQRYHHLAQQQQQQVGPGPAPSSPVGAPYHSTAAAPQQQQGVGGASSRQGARSLFAPPLTSTTAATTSSEAVGPAPRSPPSERKSAPAAAMYAVPGAGGDDDDRPLAWAKSSGSLQQQPPPQPSLSLHESYPPGRPAPAGPIPSPPPSSAYRPGFEVTSRRVSGGSITSSEHTQQDSALLSSPAGPGATAGAGMGADKHDRRASTMSDRSFDASEIYDAYAPGSPGLASAPGGLGGGAGGGPYLPTPSTPASPPPPPPPALETLPPGSVLGAVAPRGSSLAALSR